jgi:hypothetical protein
MAAESPAKPLPMTITSVLSFHLMGMGSVCMFPLHLLVEYSRYHGTGQFIQPLIVRPGGITCRYCCNPIYIDAERKLDVVEIEVRDSGPGVPDLELCSMHRDFRFSSARPQPFADLTGFKIDLWI